MKLYGIQPSGRLHIGNYLGGLRKAIDENAIILIANFHSLTSQELSGLRENVIRMENDLIGLGAKRENIITQQEDNLQLAWEIQCKTPMSDLQRMTQFKSNENPNVGLFTYPCLMAADIILSGATEVIIGEDQIQHMEFYRRTCERLGIEKVATNILTSTPRIMSIKEPIKKMSKSLGDPHCIYLFDDEENKKKIMRAPTTPEGIKNLKEIAKGFGIEFNEEECGRSKELLYNVISGICINMDKK